MPPTVVLPAIAVVELATVACGVKVICATLEPDMSLLNVKVLEVAFIRLQSSPLSSDSSADKSKVAESVDEVVDYLENLKK